MQSNANTSASANANAAGSSSSSAVDMVETHVSDSNIHGLTFVLSRLEGRAGNLKTALTEIHGHVMKVDEQLHHHHHHHHSRKGSREARSEVDWQGTLNQFKKAVQLVSDSLYASIILHCFLSHHIA